MSFDSLESLEDIAIEYDDVDAQKSSGTDKGAPGTDIFQRFRRKHVDDENNENDAYEEEDGNVDSPGLLNGLKARHREWKSNRESPINNLNSANEKILSDRETAIHTESLALGENTNKDTQAEKPDKSEQVKPNSPPSSKAESEAEDDGVKQASSDKNDQVEMETKIFKNEKQISTDISGDEDNTTPVKEAGIFTRLFQPSGDKSEETDLKAAAEALEAKTNPKSPDEPASPGILGIFRKLTYSYEEEGIQDAENEQVEDKAWGEDIVAVDETNIDSTQEEVGGEGEEEEIVEGRVKPNSPPSSKAEAEDAGVKQASSDKNDQVEMETKILKSEKQISTDISGDEDNTTPVKEAGIFTRLFQPSGDKSEEADLKAAAEALEAKTNPKSPDEPASPGILGIFRKLTHSYEEEGIQEGENKELEEEYGEVENVNDSQPSSPGLLGRFRAQLQESPDKKGEEKSQVDKGEGSDQLDQVDKETLGGGNISNDNVGLFGRFRAKLQESQEKAEEDQEEPAGNAVLNLIHRKREEWNRRGIITFPETGPYVERNIRVGKQVAEGGFSVVFHGTDADEDSEQEYALKRISISDDDMWEACEKESIICNVLKDFPTYILPILGLKMEEEMHTCYMLLPYMPNSLRAEVNGRIFSKENLQTDDILAPWDETLVLKMFYHLLHGVEAMHEIGYSHRDIKIDNILFHGSGDDSLKRPILSDFGSAGPITRPCSSRREIFEIAEKASQQTTLAYRPPELFPGALMVGHDSLNFALVDSWSLGCTLFAILFGASPFESKFSRETGELRLGDCNQLSVLSDIPRPDKSTPQGIWYSKEMWDLLEFILEKDRAKRPSLHMVQAQVSSLLTKETIPKEINKVESVDEFL